MTDTWYASLEEDGDGWRGPFDSRAEAVEEAFDMLRDEKAAGFADEDCVTAYVGQLEPLKIWPQIDGSRILERLSDNVRGSLSDDHPDRDWPAHLTREQVEELSRELDETLSRWLERHSFEPPTIIGHVEAVTLESNSPSESSP